LVSNVNPSNLANTLFRLRRKGNKPLHDHGERKNDFVRILVRGEAQLPSKKWERTQTPRKNALKILRQGLRGKRTTHLRKRENKERV